MVTWFIWFVEFISLVLFKETHETKQINKTTVFLGGRAFAASC